MSITLVSQLSVDKPAGKGVVFRPCAKSSIRIPREAERKAFEQEARLKSVYRHIVIPSVPLEPPRIQAERTSVVMFVPSSSLMPHAPSSGGPFL